MVKSGKVLVVLSFVIICFMVAEKANADPMLDIWMNGELIGSELTVEVHRTNTEFGLGGLSYDLQSSESLELSREYSDYGWIADDPIFDISNPVDGAAPGLFASIRFDTVFDPAGSEFAPGTGIVELLTITLDNFTPRWIYFDLSGPSASDGL